jgi:hypothetical protein
MAALLCTGGVLLAAGLAGCGGGGDPITRAAQISGAGAGYRILLHEQISTAALSAPITATGSGSIDQRQHEATLRFDFDLNGSSGPSTLSFDAVFAGLDFYLHLPHALSTEEPDGRPWVRIDLSPAGHAAGSGLGSLDTATSVDPAQLLDYLRAAGGKVKTVGSQRIDGVPTTHYQATIELGRLASLVPANEQAGAKAGAQTLEQLTGSSTFPVDVWIDAHDLVRRESFTFQEVPSETESATAVSITADLYDYGPQPAVTLPPSREVFDASSLASSGLANQRPSGSPPAADQASSTLR